MLSGDFEEKPLVKGFDWKIEKKKFVPMGVTGNEIWQLLFREMWSRVGIVFLLLGLISQIVGEDLNVGLETLSAKPKYVWELNDDTFDSAIYSDLILIMYYPESGTFNYCIL